MEIPASYGNGKYKSCLKCMWTGPVNAFEELPALIEACALSRCPNCGELFEAGGKIYKDDSQVLPVGFKIVSGGQTGVDRGALDAAISLGIPHSGWCPKGRKAEDGIIPERYNVLEMDDAQYWKRTERNVLDSDGTLVFPGECESKGTALTIRLAKKHGKPVAVVPLDSEDADRTVAAWLKSENIKVLNVAGPRESGSPGICRQTSRFLARLLAGFN